MPTILTKLTIVRIRSKMYINNTHTTNSTNKTRGNDPYASPPARPHSGYADRDADADANASAHAYRCFNVFLIFHFHE